VDEIRGVPLIKKVATAVERDVNNRVRSQRTTVSQVQMLLRLERAEGGMLSFKELERMLDISQAATAGLLKRLKEKKLVEVTDDPTDGRIKHAQITPLGLQTCAEAREHFDAMERSLVSGLTDLEARMFLELLQKVSETVK
jgi:DNA-binding MarR family transcriptional regulator